MPYKDKKKQQEYQKKVEKRYSICVSKISEKELIEYIDQHKPTTRFIKSLVREKMNSEQN